MKLNPEEQAAFDAMVADPEVGPMPETKGLFGHLLADAMKAKGAWHKKVKEYESAHGIKIKIPSGNGNGGADIGAMEKSAEAQTLDGGIAPSRERVFGCSCAKTEAEKTRQARRVAEEGRRQKLESEALRPLISDHRQHKVGPNAGGNFSGAFGETGALEGAMDPRFWITVQTEGEVCGKIGGLIGIRRQGLKGDLTHLSRGFGDDSDISGITCKSIEVQKAILTRMHMSGWGDVEAIRLLEAPARKLCEEAIVLDLAKGYKAKNHQKANAEFARVAPETEKHFAYLDRVAVIAEDTKENRQLVYARCLELMEETQANIIETNSRLETMGLERRLDFILCPCDVIYVKGAFVTWSDGTQSPIVSHVQAWFDDLDYRSKEEKSWRYTPYEPHPVVSDEEFWRRKYDESFKAYTELGKKGLVRQPDEDPDKYWARLMTTDDEIIDQLKPNELTKEEFLRWVSQVRIISKVRYEWKDALGQTLIKGEDELTKDFETRLLAEGMYFCEIPVYEGCGEARLLWQRPLRKDKSEWEIGPDDIKQAAARGMVEWFAYDDGTLRPHPKFGLSDERNTFDLFLALSPEEGQQYIERAQTARQLALAHSSVEERSVDGVVIDQEGATPTNRHADVQAQKVNETKRRWWGR